MELLTDLTIRPTFDQAKKKKINKIWRKNPMNELYLEEKQKIAKKIVTS